MSNYHRYERTFDEEAAISTGTYSSEPSQFKEMKQLPPDDRKLFKMELRCEKLKKDECIICLEEMQLNGQETTFMKTPCGHRYHKKCLKDWMQQRHQCPACRAALPVY